ncbi:MAG: hypothetical protein VZR00_06390 [Lachnospiraceae bacterium]|nr:hypothetical protein [Lachnospiraceae bacterium]MEE3461505.1 hypothetical protein [Lachnospiraceae bacterium]
MAEFNVKEEAKAIDAAIAAGDLDADQEAAKLEEAFHNGDLDAADAYRLVRTVKKAAKSDKAENFAAELAIFLADVVIDNEIDFKFPAMF